MRASICGILIAALTTGCGKSSLPEADFKPNIQELAKEIVGNIDAATKKYTGKVIEIDEPIASAIKGKSDSGVGYFVQHAESKTSIYFIFCPSPTSANLAWSLGKTQKVKSKGRCVRIEKSEKTSSITVVLEQSEYQETGPNPMKSVTATQLCEEFNKSELEANKNYGFKECRIDGTVDELTNVETGSLKEISVVMKGPDAKGASIEFSIDESYKTQIKVGSHLIIKGTVTVMTPEKRLAITGVSLLEVKK